MFRVKSSTKGRAEGGRRHLYHSNSKNWRRQRGRMPPQGPPPLLLLPSQLRLNMEEFWNLSFFLFPSLCLPFLFSYFFSPSSAFSLFYLFNFFSFLDFSFFSFQHIIVFVGFSFFLSFLSGSVLLPSSLPSFQIVLLFSFFHMLFF